MTTHADVFLDEARRNVAAAIEALNEITVKRVGGYDDFYSGLIEGIRNAHKLLIDANYELHRQDD